MVMDFLKKIRKDNKDFAIHLCREWTERKNNKIKKTMDRKAQQGLKALPVKNHPW